ncbi:MAG TPA: hypothetical protein VMT19_10245 [Thermoanaerobaculaceae bacterium]|nr:hypothetical protein [Thermoanaerobaculaceae bacterium]
MKRFLVLIALAAVAAAPLMAADAAAPMACCKGAGVERTVANVDNGIRVTMSAKDPKVVARLQEMAAGAAKDAGCCPECPMAMEGVTRTVEKTDSGVVITATSTNPDLVKKLQAHVAAMAGSGNAAGCCRRGAGAKASGMGGKCPYAKSDAKQS